MAIASPSRETRRRAPARRPRRPYKPIRLREKNWIVRGLLISVLAAGVLIASGAIARRLAPATNTSRDRFDAIIVLGSPADRDGNPTPEQLARVTEGVREYERGVAPRLIFSGGPAHNQYAEANIMAVAAAAQGIPPSAIFVDTKSLDTIQNACYSTRIMRSHGWRSGEIISSDYHLPRAALIFGRTPIQWRTHAAPPLQPGSGSAAESALEVLKTMRYLVYASWAERCEP